MEIYQTANRIDGWSHDSIFINKREGQSKSILIVLKYIIFKTQIQVLNIQCILIVSTLIFTEKGYQIQNILIIILSFNLCRIELEGNNLFYNLFCLSKENAFDCILYFQRKIQLQTMYFISILLFKMEKSILFQISFSN